MTETWSMVMDVQTDVKKRQLQTIKVLTALDQLQKVWLWSETLTLTLITFLLYWKQIRNTHSPTKTKWKASWRLNSQIHQLFHQFIVLKEKHQIWIYSTVWQFTAVEFQIKNTRFNFHTIIMEILDLFQWMSILLLALSQPDQELLVDDLTQFIIHDDS